MIRHNGIEIDRVRQIIHHGNLKRRFSRARIGGHAPVMFKMWEALILGDCTREQLFNLLYGDCPEGGPVNGYNILNVRVSAQQKAFAAMGLKWVSEKRGGIAHWSLVPDDVV